MKLKTFLPALLAVLLGGAAAFLVRNSMMKRPTPTTVVVAPKMVPAVTANDNLLAGQEINSESLTVTEVETTNPPQDLINNPVDLIGRVLNAPIAKGQIIRMSNLAPKGVAANLPSLVPAGMRAMTINVDEGNSLSGMLTPGCHVDVITTIAAGKESVTRTLVGNVLVQATGQRLSSAKPEDGKEPAPYHTVTLIVSARDGQLIDLAVVSSRLRLLLRPLGRAADDAGVAERVTMAELLGNGDSHPTSVVTGPTTRPVDPMAKLAIADPTKRDVTLILGNAVTHVKLEMPDAEPTQVDISNDRQRVIPEGAEPEQE